MATKPVKKNHLNKGPYDSIFVLGPAKHDQIPSHRAQLEYINQLIEQGHRILVIGNGKDPLNFTKIKEELTKEKVAGNINSNTRIDLFIDTEKFSGRHEDHVYFQLSTKYGTRPNEEISAKSVFSELHQLGFNYAHAWCEDLKTLLEYIQPTLNTGGNPMQVITHGRYPTYNGTSLEYLKSELEQIKQYLELSIPKPPTPAEAFVRSHYYAEPVFSLNVSTPSGTNSIVQNDYQPNRHFVMPVKDATGKFTDIKMNYGMDWEHLNQAVRKEFRTQRKETLQAHPNDPAALINNKLDKENSKIYLEARTAKVIADNDYGGAFLLETYAKSGKYAHDINLGNQDLSISAASFPSQLNFLNNMRLLHPNHRNQKGEGLLHEAAKYPYVDLGPLMHIITESVRGMTLDKQHQNPLHIAVEANNINVIRQMFDYGLVTPRILNEPRHKDGNTPLHLAAKQDNKELCELFVQHGANPKLKTTDNHRTAEQLYLFRTNQSLFPKEETLTRSQVLLQNTKPTRLNSYRERTDAISQPDRPTSSSETKWLTDGLALGESSETEPLINPKPTSWRERLSSAVNNIVHTIVAKTKEVFSDVKSALSPSSGKYNLLEEEPTESVSQPNSTFLDILPALKGEDFCYMH